MQNRRTTPLSALLAVALAALLAGAPAATAQPASSGLSPVELLLYGLLALLVLALTAISATTLWWMLHAWRPPASLAATGFATSDSPPAHSFSLIVPARHEEAVLAVTLERLAASHHPSFEVLAVVGDDDPATRTVAEEAAARHPGM